MGQIIATSPIFSSDWLKHETDPALHRAERVIASGSGRLRTGTVLGRITASGKMKPINPVATDGSEVAREILYLGIDATAADATSSTVTGHAVVAPVDLAWPVGITAAQKAAALAQLAEANFATVRLY
jgi:hypothetical protein